MIPVIESSGGRAFVNASVERILLEDGRAMGVTIRGRDICAPHIISTIGLLETTQYLLPPSLVQSTKLQMHVEKVKPGNSFAAKWRYLCCLLIYLH